MGFLYCNSCGWMQDNFWTKSYNPIRHLIDWEDSLFKENIDNLFSDCSEFIIEKEKISLREVLARELENSAENIRNMIWRTEKEYKNSNQKTCPVCDSELSVD